MASRLQQLLGADAELADEDFLSAVQDAENWFSVPGCSSPAGGGPGPPGTPAPTSQQLLHRLGPPPGLRPLARRQEQLAGPPPVGAAPQDELENELLVAACVELEGPELPAAPKKLRVGETQGSAGSGAQGDRQDPCPAPKLVLRPSAAGACTPVSPDPQGKPSGSCGLVPAPRGPALRPLHASPCQPRASSSSTGLRVPQAPQPSRPSPRLPLANPPACMEPPPRLPGSLQTPVVTNHLVQLVTATSKAPRAAPNLPAQGKTRRFPGPAGILPQQHTGRLLEEILVSAPQTPAHGAMAKPRTEGPPGSSLPAEEDFGKGPWLAMKTELGLDERDPSCFLRTYSVIMVLRKAALKQLPKNKVPSMAVMIKTLTRTNVDAGAVFRDPTGEMQGTVHRLLLEERQSELKPGSVLLLKQVGVFSPSHRNHYLNVTPNNLLKIYPPEPEGSLSQPSPAQEVPVEPGLPPDHPVQPPQGVTAPGDWGQGRMGGHGMKQPPRGFSLHPQSPGPGQEEPMGADGCDMDDLDGLLGELPEDFFSAPAQADCY